MKQNGWRWWKNNRVKDNILLSNWLAQARSELSSSLPEEPLSSLYAILEKNTGAAREQLITDLQFTLDASILPQLEGDFLDLKNGKPLAYILGSWDFYGLSFFMNPAVLIPRPETELLVETALEILKQIAEPCFLADVGTGSGCIAAAIAKNRPNARIIAADISRDALEVAQRNVQRHTLSKQVSLLQSDLLEGIHARFDLICANLPYIPSQALQELEVAYFEPHLALDGGEDGLSLFRRFFNQVPDHLTEGGSILLEMQFDQAERLQKLAHLHFPGAKVIIKRDLAGCDRLLVIHTV